MDAGHFATEWLWLDVARHALLEGLSARGATVDVTVSTRTTDPWTFLVRTDDDRSSSDHTQPQGTGPARPKEDAGEG